jgi:hypothetical protein
MFLPTGAIMSTDLTVAQLEKLLDNKRALLDSLEKKRERLQKQLSAVEDRISAIGGARDSRFRKIRKRPKNDKTLLTVVLEVLAEHKKGLTLGDLSSKVLETGYKTGSSHFPNTVYQCLYNNTDKIGYDAATRSYRLKTGA